MKLIKKNKPKAKPSVVKSLKPVKAAVKPAVKAAAKTAVKAAAKTIANTTVTKAAPARREITTDCVASRAHTLWEQAGRPQGRDVEYWLQAEAQLKQDSQSFAA